MCGGELENDLEKSVFLTIKIGLLLSEFDSKTGHQFKPKGLARWYWSGTGTEEFALVSSQVQFFVLKD